MKEAQWSAKEMEDGLGEWAEPMSSWERLGCSGVRDEELGCGVVEQEQGRKSRRRNSGKGSNELSASENREVIHTQGDVAQTPLFAFSLGEPS